MDYSRLSGRRVPRDAFFSTRHLRRFGLGIAAEPKSGDSLKRLVALFASRTADFESSHMLSCGCGNSGRFRTCAKPGMG